MIASKTRTIILPIVAALLASIGCEPAAEPVARSPAVAQSSQTKPRAKFGRLKIKADEDSFLTRLLSSQTVQRDLGMTTEQLQKWNDLVKLSTEQSRESAAEMQKSFPPGMMSQEESQEKSRKLHEFQDAWDGKRKELRTKALAILTPAQLGRLKQIHLQTAIVVTLEKPEIVNSLGISREQSEKIRALSDQVDEKLFADHPVLNGLSRDERRRKLIEFSEESEKASAENRKHILEVLTPAQRAKFEKLVGKQIEPKWDYESLLPEDYGDWFPN